ncbi:MAG: kelch repeat-containing protein [Pseudomonadota bacterium]
MRALVATAALFASAALADDIPPLPAGISNNAVASANVDGTPVLYSFAGIGGDFTHQAIHARTYRYRTGEPAWQRIDDIPGRIGRLAATAVTVAGTIYLFGGYEVSADGSERSLPDVHALNPATGSYTRRADMPVPVDDTVALVYADRYIYLVSGWHDVGNVNLTQRYDTETDTWQQATPWPGPAVFGHVGAISDTTLVVCDGVTINNATLPRRFVMSAACYRGDIDADNPRRINWQQLPPHPGGACYRATAQADGARLLFAGGADNPYNYTGIGYNDIPAKPCQHRYSYSVTDNRWLRERDDTDATMDHRALLRWHGEWVVVGGMRTPNKAEKAVRRLPPW